MLTTSPTLLEKLRQSDDQHAWKRFVDLYTPMLLYWAHQRNFNSADAADLTQSVLLKLLGELKNYAKGENQRFRGWLFQVVLNQAIDYRRRKATRPLPQTIDLPERGEESPISEMEETEYRLLLVRRALELIRADFNDTTWSAFESVMLKGRAAGQVAKDLGISANAVFMSRHRVLTRLRQELDGLID